ncbi:MAG: adenylate/guanylate cyclase domain-containing protein [Burkholderiales bacterium]
MMQQRLAAIFAADVCGYSRLMAADDRATVAALDAARAVFRSHIDTTGGRVIDMAGDSVLAVFDSASGALAAAMAIQADLAQMAEPLPDERRMRFRIGLHLGEVIQKDDGTIYGDGVNIAARLEGLAAPGGLTVSAAVEGAVRGRTKASFIDLGPQSVKNIPQAVHAYAWDTPLAQPVAAALVANAQPSLAVLPFDNLSKDPEQEYFADGVTEDLLTELSRYRWLTVIARNSSFTYKGRAHDVRQVGRDLGVLYVLEGSVRKSGMRIRVSCQLLDAATGNHVWAERYDREMADVFDLQDEITLTIAGAIEPELSKAEQERVRRKPVDNLDAWDLYHRGLWHLWQYTPAAHLEAKRLLGEAVARSPRFAAAHSHLALCIFSGVFNALGEPPEAMRTAFGMARHALSLDEKDPIAHFVIGRISTQMGDHATAIAELETAIRLNPSMAQAHYGLANALTVSGHAAQAIPECEAAERLSPHDMSRWAMQTVHAFALLMLDRTDEAEAMARASIRHPGSTFWAHAMLACVLGHLGRLEEARAALARVIELQPAFSAAYVARVYAGSHPEVNARYYEGLYLAGLPRAALSGT